MNLGSDPELLTLNTQVHVSFFHNQTLKQHARHHHSFYLFCVTHIISFNLHQSCILLSDKSIVRLKCKNVVTEKKNWNWRMPRQQCYTTNSGQRAECSSRGRHPLPAICLQAPKLTAQQRAVQYSEVPRELCCSPWVSHTGSSLCSGLCLLHWLHLHRSGMEAYGINLHVHPNLALL